jgi:CDP-glucose 4,6-dehydratase
MDSFKLFKGKKILITGHTGFKGSWLSAWLNSLGGEVIGIGLDPVSELNHFEVAKINHKVIDNRVDILDYDLVEEIILSSKPDYVFHLAAQALVRDSYENPVNTWKTNVIGTLHVLEALKKLKNKCTAVIITSDKCYDNVEWVWGYRETDPMGGPDPYSASKGAAELLIRSHIKSFFSSDESLVRIASARAGNVIGGGDWAADRIVPDCVKAWSNDNTVELRNPHSTRPWQHVLEPLSGYMDLAISLDKNKKLHGESFNFGPSSQQDHSVLELVQNMANFWSQVKWKDISDKKSGPYESGLLKLNCDKALFNLNWQAAMGFNDTVRMTAEWYGSYYQDPSNIGNITLKQIEEYTKIAKLMGIGWAK